MEFDAHRNTVPGQVGEGADVAAVKAISGMKTIRTRRLTCDRLDNKGDQGCFRANEFEANRLRVCEQSVDVHPLVVSASAAFIKSA